MLIIPDAFLQMQYVASRIPGSPDPADFAAGANCQLFAYQLLRHFGKILPDFRSSELWEDTTYTTQVKEFQTLDLLLYHHHHQAWGAHVGLCLGNNQIIHLSKEIGHPVIWHHHQFAQYPRYSCFIGAKRVL